MDPGAVQLGGVPCVPLYSEANTLTFFLVGDGFYQLGRTLRITTNHEHSTVSVLPVPPVLPSAPDNWQPATNELAEICLWEARLIWSAMLSLSRERPTIGYQPSRRE